MVSGLFWWSFLGFGLWGGVGWFCCFWGFVLMLLGCSFVVFLLFGLGSLGSFAECFTLVWGWYNILHRWDVWFGLLVLNCVGWVVMGCVGVCCLEFCVG